MSYLLPWAVSVEVPQKLKPTWHKAISEKAEHLSVEWAFSFPVCAVGIPNLLSAYETPTDVFG